MDALFERELPRNSEEYNEEVLANYIYSFRSSREGMFVLMFCVVHIRTPSDAFAPKTQSWKFRI